MSWEKVKVGEVSTQIRGVTYAPKDVSETEEKNFLPILRANNIQDSGLNFENVIFVNRKNISEKQLLQSGDILIAASSGSKAIVGKASMVLSNWTGSFGAFCKVIRPSEKILSKYLGYYFQSFEYRKKISHLSAGANINNLRNEDIDNLVISRPSIPTQQKLAAILDKADELRKKDQQLLAKYDTLLQSIFYDMFGDPVRNEKGWKIKNLGELTDNFKYGTNEKSFENLEKGAIPIIRIPNVLDGTVNYNDLKYSILSVKEFKDVKLEKGDLLFVRTNGNPAYIGRCAVFNDSISVGYASYLIRARLQDWNTVLPEFLQTTISFRTYRDLVLKKATTTAGNYNINTVALRLLPIYLPPISLQKKFATVVRNIQLQKQQIKNQIAQSENLFQVLLQQAFKGELVA